MRVGLAGTGERVTLSTRLEEGWYRQKLPVVEIRGTEELSLRGGAVKVEAENDVKVDAEGEVRVVGKTIHLN